MVKSILKTLVLLIYLISMVMIIDQVGVRMTAWITGFMAPLGFFVLALALPHRFNQLKLFLVWSAAVLLGAGAVAALLGASAIAAIMIPLSVVCLIVAIRMLRREPTPRPDWLWLMISAVFSGAFVYAMIIYATPLAVSPFALFAALVLGLFLFGRRKPVPVWMVGVLLITSLSPILTESANVSKTERIEKTARRIIFSNQSSGSKELTRLFNEEAKSILGTGSKFSGAINRGASGGFEVNYELSKSVPGKSYSSRGTMFSVPSP